jgi:hypothetical protein
MFIKGEGMSEQDKHLLHLSNRVHQLTQRLEAEQAENKRLKRILAEISFEGKSLLKKLERV